MTLTLATETALPTAQAWPNWLDTNRTSQYLSAEHGLDVEPKTLANMRRAGRGPAWKYFGAKPLANREGIDHWVETEALQDESPLTRNARMRAERRQAAANQPVTIAAPEAPERQRRIEAAGRQGEARAPP